MFIYEYVIDAMVVLGLLWMYGGQQQQETIQLPRGGTIIPTRIGAIQFAMPPETIKDSMNLGLEVPQIFIMPKTRFDADIRMNMAEFEFPMYYNFFILNRKIKLICDADGETAARSVFQETLLGPLNLPNFDWDFTSNYTGVPDIRAEMKYFQTNPMNASEPLTIDFMIEFVLFDNQGIADLGSGIAISRNDATLRIIDGGVVIAELRNVPIDVKPQVPQKAPIAFVTPDFGITTLGSSHGFDPKGSTSGYLFWANGQGIMVDPPAYSVEY